MKESIELPFLWIITPTISKAILREFGTIESYLSLPGNEAISQNRSSL